MTFIFPLLLGGMVLVGIPILVHLILRQKPRTLPFPAFRFLLQRHRTTMRKLRLKHLLLLALRMLLIMVVCLALARPRLVSSALGLGSERPVAAVLVFDTSPSMDYKNSAGVTRLEEAKTRALELIDDLPEGSRFVLLETGDATTSVRPEWLASRGLARERVKRLKVKAVTTSLAAPLERASQMLIALASAKDDAGAAAMPRFLCVFTDRTRACWEAGRAGAVQDALDQIPSPVEGLKSARGKIPALRDLLGDLRKKLPPAPGLDYPDQTLAEALAQVQEWAGNVTRESLPLEAKQAADVQTALRRGRELLEALLKNDAKERAEYRQQVTGALDGVLRDLSGVQGVVIDVGVDQPSNLAIVQLDVPRQTDGRPRQVYGDDEKFVLRAIVDARGQDFSTTVECKLDAKTFKSPVEIKAGERQEVPFEINIPELKLGPGFHQVEVRLASGDLLPFDNQRFFTFAVREPNRVLVLADDAKKAEELVRALKSVRFTVDVLTPRDGLRPEEMAKYQAVFLFSLAAPDAALWNALEAYVGRGGGLAIIPGGAEMKLAAYNDGPARKLMPAIFTNVIENKDKGVEKEGGALWNLEDDGIFQHPLLARFRHWRGDKNIDFIRYPRGAFYYWDLKLDDKGANPLVRYADDKGRPALVEKLFDPDAGVRGKVLLFTTTLDVRDPRWNNYLESLTSFYLVVSALSTSYLTGEAEAPQLNFDLGQGEPSVALPLSPRFPGFLLRGPEQTEQVPAPEKGGQLAFKQTEQAGLYVVEGVGGERPGLRVGAFSVNYPSEESDLTRVPAVVFQSLFGVNAVAPVDRKGSLRTALEGHWNEPVDLLPYLLLGLLLFLAVENLLANKFYRREETPNAIISS